MPILAPVLVSVVAAAVVVWLIVVAARHANRQEALRIESWRRFASDHGLQFVEVSGPWYARRPAAVEGRFEGVPLRLETYVVSTGKSHITLTRVRGSTGTTLASKVISSPRGFGTGLVEALGWRSTPTGDAAYDAKMVTRSKSRDAALSILGDRVRALALEDPRGLHIECKDREAKVWWRGAEGSPSVLVRRCKLGAALIRSCARA